MCAVRTDWSLESRTSESEDLCDTWHVWGVCGAASVSGRIQMTSSEKMGRDPLQVMLPIHKTAAGP